METLAPELQKKTFKIIIAGILIVFHSKIDQLHKFAGGFFSAFGSKFYNAGRMPGISMRIGGACGPVLARGP
jgi:hypothetical protein